MQFVLKILELGYIYKLAQNMPEKQLILSGKDTT
jgi:hypothetical protein